MKKIIAIILTTTLINAELQSVVIQDAMIEGMKKGISELPKAGASVFRTITHTRTKEEECNSKIFKDNQKYSHEWWEVYHQNQKMIKVLNEKKINYSIIVKQKKAKKIDLKELKKNSCSKDYFEKILRQRKENNEIIAKNLALNELMKKNNLHIAKSTYEQIEINEDLKRKKAKEELKKQMNF